MRKLFEMKFFRGIFMKKNYIFLVSLFFASNLFAENFQIKSVKYSIQGNTNESALIRKFYIDKNIIFKSENELISYINELKTQFNNERNFESSNITYSKIEQKADIKKIQFVELYISVCDSKHFLALPYPKYDSNSGLSAKLKIKDTNFAGTLNELNADFIYETERDENNRNKINQKIGGNFQYDFPFRLGKINATWKNKDNITYTVANKNPEFNLNTGLTFELPFSNFSLLFDINQELTENFNYKKYADDLYGRTTASFSVPVNISKSFSGIKILHYILADCAYDKDGINIANKNLNGLSLSAGQNFLLGQINWVGNFRNGFFLNAGFSFGWDFQLQDFITSISVKTELFKAFNRFGFNSRFFGFFMKNRFYEFTSRLRGISDIQFYSDYTDKYGFRISSADEKCGVVFNFDFPVSLFTTSFGKFYDFEFQVVPFVDIALTSNQKTGRFFYPADGYYTSGFEFLIYPLKWKSIVVRASLGFDLSKIFGFESGTNKTVDKWNDECSNFEAFIGIGWHY